MAGSMNFFSLFSCILVLASITSALVPNVSPVLAPEIGATGLDCTSFIYDMVDCISYLYVGSTEKIPDTECCFGLQTVLKTDGECVCEVLKSSAQMGFDIDMDRAMSLPSACNTKAPSLDSCRTSNAPATSPVATPANPRSTTPAPAPKAVLVSVKSPTLAPHARSPESSVHVSPTSSITAHHAPAPAPKKAGAYSLVISPAVHLCVLVATFFYLLA